MSKHEYDRIDDLDLDTETLQDLDVTDGGLNIRGMQPPSVPWVAAERGRGAC